MGTCFRVGAGPRLRTLYGGKRPWGRGLGGGDRRGVGHGLRTRSSQERQHGWRRGQRGPSELRGKALGGGMRVGFRPRAVGRHLGVWHVENYVTLNCLIPPIMLSSQKEFF